MKKLYILCGLPFAGKSLLSKEIENKIGAKLISFDKNWVELSKTNFELNYETALEDCKNKIKENLQNNISVIYDSTNTHPATREIFINLAKENNAEPIIIYLEVPLEEIKRRRAQSLIDKTHHEVSDENFNRSIEHLEAPAEAIILKNEKDKKDFLDKLAS
ncbi:MAG: ATP-binding protein [Candidatus Paceibacterota bacterium]